MFLLFLYWLANAFTRQMYVKQFNTKWQEKIPFAFWMRKERKKLIKKTKLIYTRDKFSIILVCMRLLPIYLPLYWLTKTLILCHIKTNWGWEWIFDKYFHAHLYLHLSNIHSVTRICGTRACFICTRFEFFVLTNYFNPLNFWCKNYENRR